MKALMSTNVYEPFGRMLLVGTCLPGLDPAACAPLLAEADCVYAVCLEETHLNMVITKIAAVLGTNRVKSLSLATVDRSPHCTQLHYLRHEIERTMPLHPPITGYVLSEGALVPVPEAAAERSRNLAALARELPYSS